MTRRVDASQMDAPFVQRFGKVEEREEELPVQMHGEPMLPYGTWRSLFVILLAVWSLYSAAPYLIRWLS